MATFCKLTFLDFFHLISIDCDQFHIFHIALLAGSRIRSKHLRVVKYSPFKSRMRCPLSLRDSFQMSLLVVLRPRSKDEKGKVPRSLYLRGMPNPYRSTSTFEHHVNGQINTTRQLVSASHNREMEKFSPSFLSIHTHNVSYIHIN
jgi:hypothetical protein